MLTGTHSWIHNEYYETKNNSWQDNQNYETNLSQKRRVVPGDNISRC